MSLPFSPAPSARKSSGETEWDSVAHAETGIYVVCLDCGRRFDYDWSEMRVVK
ncbi:MAG TPA: hypothetical protein VL240_04905 [Candidatus Binatia bacterium]|nr:hypothetical protein [Candidatus Binatia bacterium]